MVVGSGGEQGLWGRGAGMPERKNRWAGVSATAGCRALGQVPE